jgi:hypothetical protein
VDVVAAAASASCDGAVRVLGKSGAIARGRGTAGEVMVAAPSARGGPTTGDGGFEVLGMAGGFGRSGMAVRSTATDRNDSTLTASTATRGVAAQAQLRADVGLHLPTDARVTERFLRFATGTRGASPVLRISVALASSSGFANR